MCAVGAGKFAADPVLAAKDLLKNIIMIQAL